MKFPYSSPNLRIIDLVSALFLSERNAEKKIKQYFSQLTGKKFILITNSCRSALYLTYKSIRITGEVITSPLTCKVAIDPIVESENKPIFADIKLSDLNIDPYDIPHRINTDTIAIQMIHLGGISCDMDAITRIATENKLWIIEDCAQSLGALYEGKHTGTFGDISCFSLIKNAYGIGGGILATDSFSIYTEALKLNQRFTKTPVKLLLFRIIRNIIDTKRIYRSGRFLFNSLMKFKDGKRSYENVAGQLHQISWIEKKIAAHQIKRYQELHQKRKEIGKEYYDRLSSHGILQNNGYNKEYSSFTKFFIYNSKFNSKKNLQFLHDQGIEVMHLEHKRGGPYQERLVSIDQANKWRLFNYSKVHDCLISPPVSEAFKNKHVNLIVDNLKIL